MEIFRNYKNKSTESHQNKHTVKVTADQQELNRSQWLTNVLEELKQRWPSSFGNVSCLKTAISVRYLHTHIKVLMVVQFFRL